MIVDPDTVQFMLVMLVIIWAVIAELALICHYCKREPQQGEYDPTFDAYRIQDPDSDASILVDAEEEED